MAYNLQMPVKERELLQILDENECHLMAGGTDLLVKIRLKRIQPKMLVSLARLEGMNEIADLGECIFVGCRTTMSELLQSDLVNIHSPITAKTLREVGSPQIRNRATLVGNLVNASPAGDSIVALYLSKSAVLIRSSRGERTENAIDFIKGPGKTTLKRGEYVRAILIQKTREFFTQFYKVGQRSAMAIAVASVGSLITDSEMRIAYGSVAPSIVIPVEAQEYYGKTAEDFDDSEFTSLALLPISPIDDVRASAWYRSTVVKKLIGRTLNVWRKRG
jgi:CO/xanthine dehydrogenase FAD-binding subunit